MILRFIQFAILVAVYTTGCVIGWRGLGVIGPASLAAFMLIGGAWGLWLEHRQEKRERELAEVKPDFCYDCGHHKDAHRKEAGCLARGVWRDYCMCKWNGEQSDTDPTKGPSSAYFSAFGSKGMIGRHEGVKHVDQN